MRQLSVADSVAEFFDASEVLLSECSSENEVSDESGLSDGTTINSEPEEDHGELQLSEIYIHPIQNYENFVMNRCNVLFHNVIMRF